MRRSRGFSLIEMSIVLVLIALMVGAIVGGQSLMRSSQVNKAVSEAQKYLQAVEMFRQKHSALPGDFTGAVARWNNEEATVNGNGDGVLTTATEGLRAWQHLRLSGVLTEGASSGSGALQLDANLPASRPFEGAGYQLAGAISVFGINRGNVLLFGRINGAELTYGALTAKQAKALDEKMDDGQADKGTVLGVSGKENSTAGCTTVLWNASPPASYNLADTQKKCYMVYLLRNDKF